VEEVGWNTWTSQVSPESISEHGALGQGGEWVTFYFRRCFYKQLGITKAVSFMGN